jgi:hypothetical protein
MSVWSTFNPELAKDIFNLKHLKDKKTVEDLVRKDAVKKSC